MNNNSASRFLAGLGYGVLIVSIIPFVLLFHIIIPTLLLILGWYWATPFIQNLLGVSLPSLGFFPALGLTTVLYAIASAMRSIDTSKPNQQK